MAPQVSSFIRKLVQQLLEKDKEVITEKGLHTAGTYAGHKIPLVPAQGPRLPEACNGVHTSRNQRLKKLLQKGYQLGDSLKH